jgi:protoporphyrinogen/coproporphyrinogen III oxidase
MTVTVSELPRVGRAGGAPLRVAIAGGGVTGLAAAYALETQTDVPVEVTLLESDSRLGGKVRSDQVGTLLVERGPDALFIRTPAALELLERIGLDADIISANPRHRQSYILRDGRLHPIPDGMQSGVPRELRPLATTRLLSPWGKLRAASEVFIARGSTDEDESVDAFVRRRFGSEVADRIAAPLLGGIYSSDPRRLSLQATAPYLRQTEREHGSLLRAALRQRRSSSPTVQRGRFVSIRGGLERIPRALQARLARTRVRLSTPLESVEVHGTDGLRLILAGEEQLVVDRLLLAVPAPVAGRLLGPLVPGVADHLTQVRYASVVVVALAFPADACAGAPAGSGYIVAPGQGGVLAACSWSSNKWPHCAPNGDLLLRCHLHLDDQPELLAASDDVLVESVRDELRRTLGLTAVPSFARVFRWPHSIPSYSVGHLERMAAVDRLLAAELPGVVLAGAAYRGVGVLECIRQGEEAAARILAQAEAPV